MEPEVLLSAMYLDNENYIDTLNIHTDCVVINQCDREGIRRVVHDSAKGEINITYVETKDRGLSRSRNEAIGKARGDICILCDNDVEYVEDYDRIIREDPCVMFLRIFAVHVFLSSYFSFRYSS